MSDEQRIQPALEVRRKTTPEEQAELDRIVEASRRAVQAIVNDPKPVQATSADLDEAENRSARARRALDKLRYDWLIVRELGGSMPDSFWVTFGKAAANVLDADGALSLMKPRKGR